MQKISTQMIRTLALIFAGALLASQAFADKPSWAGGGKSLKRQQEEQQTQDRDTVAAPGTHFDDRQRAIIRDYFEGQSRNGRCPPGLAKKNNGCLPPGQAKKWAVGQPFPNDMAYHELPQKVLEQLGAPPAGHRYVRAAADILLIAVGTGMVVDAIEDLGRK